MTDATISAETRDQLEDLLTRMAGSEAADIVTWLLIRREAAAILPLIRAATPRLEHTAHPAWVSQFVGIIPFTDPDCAACAARNGGQS